MSRQTLVLRRIPASELEEVQAIYLKAGATVESAKQEDGSYTLRITVEIDEVA